MAKKIAVLLSGCGVYDGSEIYETVLTLLRLDQSGAEYQCIAPNDAMMHVINHMTGEEMSESRNILVEAARLARGNIIDLAEAKQEDFDGLILPGGFGAAKNLCDFAVKGADMSIRQDVIEFVRSFHEALKPVGLMCIAPVMVPQLFGEKSVCTIGTDPSVAEAITAMGGEHQDRAVDDICVDPVNKLVTTPAYMLAGGIFEASKGIFALVDEVLSMIKKYN
ncbi:isoprenoid biosynthesis glyoxalase ElbB [Litoribrevibacter euphylliae]|uniref:Glyoxalase n=1 Tax=Litoribrevibacter euphylliae TaxID=1834034 RepID=A0ABV7HLH3_9GAMM